MLRQAYLISSLLAYLGHTVHASHAEPAWHGEVTPGSDTTQQDKVPFTPYWVPYGSESVDDTDKHLHYSPLDAWKVEHSSDYIDQTSHLSSTPDASLSFTFTGTGIEWYGSTSPEHGKAEVWLDNHHVKTVNLYSKQTRSQQMLFSTAYLAHDKHTLKIVVAEQHDTRSSGDTVDIDAFVIQSGESGKVRRSISPRIRMERRKKADSSSNEGAWSGTTQLVQKGNSGIAAMQLAVIDDQRAIIVDKVEHNLLTVNGHPAWGAIYDFTTHQARPLDVKSNSFCAGGSWLGNGTLINVGGNPVTSDHTGSADFGDVNGLQAIRMFDPCDGGNCDIYENPERIRMASSRWYSSVARLSDGSAMIMGGATKGGWINNQSTNNPSIEYYPPKNLHGSKGLPIQSPFLVDTLNANLFPIIFHLPDDRIFVAANRQSMIYNWQTNEEQRLPDFPNGVRVTYPMTAGSVMLPLTPENNYTPEILICGGSTVDDTRPDTDISSQEPASDQCVRMVLDDAGIAGGWQVENMPEARHMTDMVLMPDGAVLIVNGAKTGVSGYGNVKDQIGQSNADHPNFTPVLYRPSAPAGQRFSSKGMPTSDIARLYHSVATLLPSGAVLIAGSNPNLDRTTAEYPTEYRVETLSPPYMTMDRPSYSGLSDNVEYNKVFNLQVDLPAGTQIQDITVSLVDLGFVTHAVHMNSRLVGLVVKSLSSDGKTLTVVGPPSPQVYPPGPGWLYILANGIPSEGKKVMVGDGSGPPVDEEAIANVLRSTAPIADVKTKKKEQ